MNKQACVAAILLAWSCFSSAQFIADDPDWKETDAGPAPAFDLKRLVPFEISARSELKWGLDPATIVIDKKDGVVRYVVVAQSSSGTVNAFYEGIRCSKGQHKLYARHNPSAGWITVQNSDWTSLFQATITRHSLALAKQGICDGAAPASSIQEILRRLKSGGAETGR